MERDYPLVCDGVGRRAERAIPTPVVLAPLTAPPLIATPHFATPNADLCRAARHRTTMSHAVALHATWSLSTMRYAQLSRDGISESLKHKYQSSFELIRSVSKHAA